MKKIISFFVFSLFVFFAPFESNAEKYQFSTETPIGQILTKLPENHWVRLNNNKFKNVWTPLNQRPAPEDAPSVGDPSRIITAWSSMAWDGNRGDLIFWGGGHANYPGNEVYRWRATSLEWQRASLPSEVVQVGSYSVHYEPVDGMMNAPISAHTYDNSEFLPIVDRFVTFGGAVFNGGAIFSYSDGTITGPYFWDPSRANPDQVGGTTGSHVNPGLFPEVTGGQMWENRDNLKFSTPTEPRPPGINFINGVTGYGQEDGRDVLYIQETNSLFKYTVVDVNDPLSDIYEKVGSATTTFSGQGAGAYDPDRNIFLRTSGSGVFTFWRLDSPGRFNGNVVFTPRVVGGTFNFGRLPQYGLDYDSVRKVFVLWDGNSEVWTLTPPADLTNGEWSLSSVVPDSTENPTASTSTAILTGILGKWKYIRDLDVFLGVFDPVNGDIWAYKPRNWQPVPSDDHPPVMVYPQGGEYFLEGSDIRIEVAALDADQSIERIDFYANGLKVGEDDFPPYSFTWENAPAGVHELKVVSSDNGHSLISLPVIITGSKIDPSIKTVTLRDGVDGYSGTEDSYLYQYYGSVNYGNSAGLVDSSSGWLSSAVIRFAIFQSEGGPVPDGVVIETAYLNVYKNTYYDHVYRAFSLLRNWQEDEITWNRASIGVPWTAFGANCLGMDIAEDYDGQGAVGWDPQWLTIDVSPGIKRVADGASPNYGWKILGVSGNSNPKMFLSSEYSDQAFRPSLIIEYREVVTGNLSPRAVVTSPSDGIIFETGALITINAEASDPDGTISRVEFYRDAIKLGEVNSAPYSFSWTAEQAGTYSLSVVATDNDNASIRSSAVSVTVAEVNAVPAVTMTAPVDGATIVEGEVITLAAEAFDSDGSVVRVEFFAGAIKLGEDSSAPYTLLWPTPSAGAYSLSAVAVDDAGGVSSASVVNVVVTESGTGALTVLLRDGFNGYDGTRDAYLYEYQTNSNFGKSTSLQDQATKWIFTSLVRFAIFQSEGGPVPDGAVIESATLGLYKSSYYDHLYRLHPLWQDWREDEVTWTRAMAGVLWFNGGATGAGLDISENYDGEGTVGWAPQWLEVNLTAGVQRMSTGGAPNYGWKLVPVSGNSNTKRFISSESAGDPGLRPTLTITYREGD